MIDPKSSPLARRLTRPRSVAGLLAMAGLAIIACWNADKIKQVLSFGTEGSTQPKNTSPAEVFKNPDESFETLRQVVERDGDSRTHEAAIAWLDRCSRESGVTADEQKSFLLSMLEKNGNSAWESGYRQHLFKSTFNALRRAGASEPLHRILQKMAVSDPDRTLRLYALQHIGLERGSDRLKGTLTDEIHKTLSNLAAEPDGEVAGLAVALLTTWNGNDSPVPVDGNALEVALSIAADPTSSVDNRVTAMHAAGAASLPLVRKMAMDANEPVFLRKAAIARIGVNGDAADLVPLEKLRGENSRLAQAAEPALQAIRDRIDHPLATQPIPF